MAYTVTLKAAGSDGTNIFTEMEISDGARTFPLIRPTFPVGTTAAVVTAYMQKVANNAPALASELQTIVNSRVIGV